MLERLWRAGRFVRYNVFFAKRSSQEVLARGAIKEESRVGNPAGQALIDHTPNASYRPPPGFAHAELLAGATIRLTFTTGSKISWGSGQHFLLTIPAVSRWKSHPFTCCSLYHEAVAVPGQHTMIFLIRARKGWTKDLWDTVVARTNRDSNSNEGALSKELFPGYGVLLRMYVDGPFGSSVRVKWVGYSSVMIVVGGSGVTFGLAVLEDICTQISMANRTSQRVRRVRFVWLVREFGKCSSAVECAYSPLCSRSYPVVCVCHSTVPTPCARRRIGNQHIRNEVIAFQRTYDKFTFTTARHEGSYPTLWSRIWNHFPNLDR